MDTEDLMATIRDAALDAVDAEGTVPVPDGPGLGVEYDWEYVEANATGSVHVYD